MLRKRLVKVSKGSVYPILFALVAGMLCVAHSREQDEVYQDPYADPNERSVLHTHFARVDVQQRRFLVNVRMWTWGLQGNAK